MRHGGLMERLMYHALSNDFWQVIRDTYDEMGFVSGKNKRPLTQKTRAVSTESKLSVTEIRFWLLVQFEQPLFCTNDASVVNDKDETNQKDDHE